MPKPKRVSRPALPTPKRVLVVRYHLRGRGRAYGWLLRRWLGSGARLGRGPDVWAA